MDVIEKLNLLKEQRHWTNYRIAKESNLPQSTVENIFRRKTNPQIDTLEILCKAFGLTLSQFFVEDERNSYLNDAQVEIVKLWDTLDQEEKEAIKAIIKLLSK